MSTCISELGCWYYEEECDKFISINKEIERIKDIRLKLYKVDLSKADE